MHNGRMAATTARDDEQQSRVAKFCIGIAGVVSGLKWMQTELG